MKSIPVLRLIVLVGVMALLTTCFYPVFATESTQVVEIEYLEDGSFFETTVKSEPTPFLGITALSNATTVTKSKTTKYKNASGVVQWYVKVTGTFRYGGGSSTCTACSVTAESKSASWKVSNRNCSHSGSTASASATGKHYEGSTIIKTVKKTVKLTCSPSGEFS